MILRRLENSRQRQFRRGFTIIEIVVVMSILVLLIGASYAYLNGLGPEKTMREACVELESMAREAQARAIMTHTPQRVVITGKKFLLMQGDAQPKSAEEWVTLPTRKQYEIQSHDEVQVSIYRWGSSDPVFPTERYPLVWLFPPDGFVEPITIRLVIDESYIKQTYHPLTASVIEEEMEIR